MIFSSFEFIFAFLPIVFLVYLLLGVFKNSTLSKAWLVLASLFFYGFWEWNYLYLIGGSILVNFALGRIQLNTEPIKTRKALLWLAIILNLLLLGYFKYLNFFLDSVSFLTDGYEIEKIILPIGLSFYTFQQISYQVDAYAKKVPKYNFLNYSLFVSFFPQLIAGPIVHHSEMMPQFDQKTFMSPRAKLIIIGISIFCCGLFKKVVLADNFAVYANPVFNGAHNLEATLTFSGAWIGAFAYAFQLYFDFSGYSDMAVGLGAMFGIKLPFNFFSPLKGRNMIEFWRRWHMSLTREITNLLYNPIAMSAMRTAMMRRYKKVFAFVYSVAIPTIIVWAIVGAWHGAGWNFVLMGLLYGACIIFNHFTKQFIYQNKKTPVIKHISKTPDVVAIIATFFFFVLASVLFRSQSMMAAGHIYSSMFGFGNLQGGLALSTFELLDGLWFLAAAVIIWGLPNSIEYFSRYKVGIDIFGFRQAARKPRFPWRLNTVSVLFCLSLAGAAFYFLATAEVSEFIYFDF